MKEKIIEIIGFRMESKRAELKASQIIILFNQRIVDAFKEVNNTTGKLSDALDKTFIAL